ncbi:MAG: hypothetical protein C0401_11755 [Anaerolinea sp.]|nr:hypothetical protein [Anaerolinea sp.]
MEEAYKCQGEGLHLEAFRGKLDMQQIPAFKKSIIQDLIEVIPIEVVFLKSKNLHFTRRTAQHFKDDYLSESV